MIVLFVCKGSGLLMVGLGMSFASTFVYGVLYVHVERSYAAEGLAVLGRKLISNCVLSFFSAKGLNPSCDPLKLIFWQAIMACNQRERKRK